MRDLNQAVGAPLQTPVMQHTPGPWVFGSFGRLLVVPLRDGLPQKHDPICDFGAQHFPSIGAEYANAKLVAAAPDMLNALRSLLRLAERMQEVMDDECGIRFRDDGPMSMARDALRLAIGAA